MKVLMYWIGVFICVALGHIIQGGHIGSVMQGTAAIMVFGPVLSYMFYRYGLKDFFGFWKRTLTNGLTEQDAKSIDTIALVGYSAGSFAVVLGLIHVMENLADASKLGAGIAVAFVGAFYGVLPALMFIPLTTEKGGTGISLNKLVDKKTAGFYSFFVFSTLLFSFFTILYAQASHG